MVTDKDREICGEIETILREYALYGNGDPDIAMPEVIANARAESAEQARKEAADNAEGFYVWDCGGCGEKCSTSCDTTCSHIAMLRAAILSPLQNAGNGEQVPSERNKLECIKSMRATLLAIAQTPIAYVCEKTRKLARAEWEKSKGFEE